MNTGKRQADPVEQVRGWFLGRVPDGWFAGTPKIVLDREEITVIGHLPAVESAGETGAGAKPEHGPAAPQPEARPGAAAGTGAGGGAGTAAGTGVGAGADAGSGAGVGTGPGPGPKAERDAIAVALSRRFREETRQARVAIAREAELLFARKVSWGVVCEGRKVMFTTLSVPVMTRLRQPERRVLDTLVDAGVARSRSDALAWCVRLVGEHEDSWLADLREALRRVEQVRAEGPRA
jgi:hypothetical protein